MTTNPEVQEQAVATAVAEEPEASKKASAAPRKPQGAPAKAKSSKKASPTKKAPKTERKPSNKPEKKARAAREGSKTDQVIELMKRPGGVTLRELMAATNWQAHSVRGFVSGTLGKKMRLTVTSAKREDGERVYSLAN